MGKSDSSAMAATTGTMSAVPACAHLHATPDSNHASVPEHMHQCNTSQSMQHVSTHCQCARLRTQSSNIQRMRTACCRAAVALVGRSPAR